MKRKLLEILACPLCRGDLKLEIMEEKDGEIRTGLLSCAACRQSYPIVDGIPNLLPLKSRSNP
jgi:uncharacterized protein YbaR (Trm112 family)